jgi:hypothetical protein
MKIEFLWQLRLKIVSYLFYENHLKMLKNTPKKKTKYIVDDQYYYHNL